MIRIRNVTLALLLLGVVSACGVTGSSGGGAGGGQAVTPGSGSSKALSGNQKVTIKNFAFSPASLTVKKGTKVTFTNEDTVVHTATSTNKTINSGNLAKGQSYTVTFTKPGTYNYICEIHNYMKGTVIVQ